ncbi:MAG: DUF6869 domain-containing protein, partial [Mycobacteriales bacterium]
RERISDDPDPALGLLEALLSVDEANLVYLGAGPLEDLLVEHGARMAGAIAERCGRSARWRKALSAVWLDDREWAAVEPLHAWLPKRE